MGAIQTIGVAIAAGVAVALSAATAQVPAAAAAWPTVSSPSHEEPAASYPSGVGIHAGAGPIDGPCSPTSRSAELTSCS